MAEFFDGYREVLNDLKDRVEWENRQATYYRMRHQGLRRRFKPYEGAADLHFPLVDSLIERLKAFYFQQLYATATLANFVSLKPQEDELTSGCGSWMDYRLKQRSNFERATLTTIDHMLLSGLCPQKIYWDDKAKRVCFKPINPIHMIVPKYTVEINDAPRVVHVLHMSVADYKRNENFNSNEDLLKRIKGKGSNDSSGANALYQDKMAREGLTIAASDDEVLLWEVYTRETDGILVQTFSPLAPNDTDKIRPDFTLPYDQGEFRSKDVYPFSVYQMEIKDEGMYSPRGIAEINAAFETSLCKMWNQKHDWMDYFNRPTYSSERNLGNLSNWKQQPGQILPPGITPNMAVNPPMSFDEEMQGTRALAEYRTNIPDLGANQHLAGKAGAKGDVTATQINAIVGQSGLADDMRVRVFRMGMADSLRKAWSLYLQYDKDSLDYIVGESVSKIDKSALHGDYLIQPNGSADSWNKGLQMQKAYQRMQQLGQNPYIHQDELVKSVLELDDPGLVKRLYADPGLKQQDDVEQQSIETVLMLNNFGAPVHPSDDDKAHLQALAQFGQMRYQEGQPVTPMQAQAFLQHIQGHLQGLQTKKDKASGQFQKLMRPMMELLSQMAQQPPQNVVPMNGDPSQQQAPQGQPQDGGKQPDPQENAAKLMNAFAAMAKAGLPIGIAQINSALAEAGCPPITVSTPPIPLATGAPAA